MSKWKEKILSFFFKLSTDGCLKNKPASMYPINELKIPWICHPNHHCICFESSLRAKRIAFWYDFKEKKERNKVKFLSHVRLFATPWTVAHQAPPSMEFSRQEYWGELPFPSPGYLPNPGIEPGTPALQTDTLPSESPIFLAFLYQMENFSKIQLQEKILNVS